MLQRSVDASPTGGLGLAWPGFTGLGFVCPWRPQIIIYLQPDQLRFVQYGKGLFKRSVTQDKTISLVSTGEPAYQLHPNQWEHAVIKIKQKLPQLVSRDMLAKTQIHIVIANQFVRYLLLPWDHNIATREEKYAFLQYHFQLAFAESMDAWNIQVGAAAYGQPTLVTAMPKRMISALKNIHPDILLNKTYSKTRLISQGISPLSSITPALIAAINAEESLSKKRWADNGWLANKQSDNRSPNKRLPNKRWIVHIDIHHCCLGLIENQHLKSIHQYTKEANVYKQIHGLITRESVMKGDDQLTMLPIVLIDQHPLNIAKKFKALPELGHFFGTDGSAV